MAKRSFDIGRKPVSASPRPKKRRRTKAKKEKPEKAKGTHPRLSTRSPKKKLRDRKRDAFTRTAVLTVLTLLACAGGLVYVFWLPSLRITEVSAADSPNPSLITSVTKQNLSGTYDGFIPKNSFFFYPEHSIRAAILDADPRIAAVSFTRTSFTALSIKTSPRVAAFLWCGSPASLSAEDTTCYEADSEGLVFVQADTSASSTTNALLHVYANLDTSSTTGTYPLKARVEGSEKLPAILRFAHQIEKLKAPLASVAIRGDEADLFVAPSTRITYVIGHEKQAEESAQAALPKLTLTDGSLVYVDLRFDGKVYVKRKGE